MLIDCQSYTTEWPTERRIGPGVVPVESQPSTGRRLVWGGSRLSIIYIGNHVRVKRPDEGEVDLAAVLVAIGGDTLEVLHVVDLAQRFSRRDDPLFQKAAGLRKVVTTFR